MKNPISDSSGLGQEWRRKLGNLSFDQVIKMIENDQPIPWRIPPSWVRTLDREEIQSIFIDTGMAYRTKMGGYFTDNDDVMEITPINMSPMEEDWLPYHYPVRPHIVQYWNGPVTGFRIVRNKQ